MFLENFKRVRNYTESLCKALNVEDYVPQSAEFTSPPKWHLAHTSWFFEEMLLKKYLPQYAVFDDDFGFLFNSYYQSIGERALRKNRGLITRPSVAEVYQYRHYVDTHISTLLALIENKPEQSQNKRIYELITLGIQHEQQHQELLLTDLKFTFSHNPTHPVYDKNASYEQSKQIKSATDWVSIREGVYEIGYKGDGFCFDNELACHKVYLSSVDIATTLVSNRDYIAFIEAGGYQNFSYWLDEGWHWVTQNHINQPLYWHKIEGEWFYYTLAGLQKIDLEAPVCHVSYYEANAFAQWRGTRLPTEYEWEIASTQFSWGQRWEWTSSSYLPYPGFEISEGAVGEYNGKFMVNQMVLRGASSATSPEHSRNTYRNFFHPQSQWQFTGIRLVKGK